MERFVGGLIEHYAGAFPLWLAPVQVRVLPISEEWADSARQFGVDLRARGIRSEVVERESLNYRIREAEMAKVPYMCVIGERETAQNTIAVRKRGAGKKQEVIDRGTFLEAILEEIRTRALG
jgi:threonyl-tRNA synthetase